MINLGTLKEITDLRSVWSHEALNFTPWVAENVDCLQMLLVLILRLLKQSPLLETLMLIFMHLKQEPIERLSLKIN